MTDINRIRFSITKSPHVRCYGISSQVTKGNSEFTLDEPIHLPAVAGRVDTSVSYSSATALNRLLDIPGVTHLRVRPYEINVTLASVYDWTDVHDKIIEILKDGYFEGVKKVDVTEIKKSPHFPAGFKPRAGGR